MRKIAVLLCFLFVIFSCGCSEIYSPFESAGVTITYPKDETLNGYKLPSSEPAAPYSPLMPETSEQSEASESDITYCHSKNSKKFHLSTCYVVKRIDPQNLITTKNRKELTDKGFEPCKSCKP